MDWQERMNQALVWLELHLTEEIDWEDPAREACCSVFHFLRMFEVITGVTAAEYVRRRRLSLAALQLAGSETRILDVAIRFGYESRTLSPGHSARFLATHRRRRASREFVCDPIPPSPSQSSLPEDNPWIIESKRNPSFSSPASHCARR